MTLALRRRLLARSQAYLDALPPTYEVLEARLDRDRVGPRRVPDSPPGDPASTTAIPREGGSLPRHAVRGAGCVFPNARDQTPR